MTGQRIRLSRQAGARKPANAVVVARPSKWGNVFVIEQNRFDKLHGQWRITCAGIDQAITTSRAEANLKAVDYYRGWLAGEWDEHLPDGLRTLRERIISQLHTLAGHDLACWCRAEEPCHADVLLSLASQLEQVAS